MASEFGQSLVFTNFTNHSKLYKQTLLVCVISSSHLPFRYSLVMLLGILLKLSPSIYLRRPASSRWGLHLTLVVRPLLTQCYLEPGTQSLSL